MDSTRLASLSQPPPRAASLPTPDVWIANLLHEAHDATYNLPHWASPNALHARKMLALLIEQYAPAESLTACVSDVA